MVNTMLSLCAKDIMKNKVATSSPKHSLRNGLEWFLGNHVTDHTVLDSRNRLLGVISATDRLNFENENVGSNDNANAETARNFDSEKDH